MVKSRTECGFSKTPSQPPSGFRVSATLAFSLVAKSCQELVAGNGQELPGSALEI